MGSSKGLILKEVKVKADIETSFFYRDSDQSDQLVILLHGYKQIGMDFFEWVEKVIPKNIKIFAPNGPYPVPIRSGDHYKMTYSWFFFDAKTGSFVRDMELSLKTLHKQLDGLGWLECQTKVLGFSQGGYLAPHLSKVIDGIDWICGIGSRYRFEDFQDAFQFPIYSIHGTEDPLVDFKNSEASFKKMLSKGNRGKFFEIPGMGHELNSESLGLLRSLFSDEEKFE